MGELRAVVELPALLQSPAAARAVVGAVLVVWGLPRLVDDARLLVSELVSNAVVHAAGSESFELEIVRHRGDVWVGLTDGCATTPIARELRPDTTSGRGVQIMQQLATRWGTEQRRGGKRVWFELVADVDLLG